MSELRANDTICLCKLSFHHLDRDKWNEIRFISEINDLLTRAVECVLLIVFISQPNWLLRVHKLLQCSFLNRLDAIDPQNPRLIVHYVILKLFFFHGFLLNLDEKPMLDILDSGIYHNEESVRLLAAVI
jgi:hypothetical protein